MKQVKLGELTRQLLQEHDVWQASADTSEEDDMTLNPAEKDLFGMIPKHLGEVWCLGTAVFFNRDVHIALCMCRGDRADGPLLLRIFTDSKNSQCLPLSLPPSADHALATQGPIPFCRAFGKTLLEVFPIIFQVVPLFRSRPRKRKILLHADGQSTIL